MYLKGLFEVIGHIIFQQVIKTFLPPNRNAQAHTTGRSTRSSVAKMVRLLRRVSTCCAIPITSHIIICADTERHTGKERESERAHDGGSARGENESVQICCRSFSLNSRIVERRQDKNNKVESDRGSSPFTAVVVVWHR